MKINGLVFEGPKSIPCVIPVGNAEIVFLIKPVLDYDGFDKVCPRPEPPTGIDGKGNKTVNTSHPTYLEAIDTWAQQRMDWLFLQAIVDTEGLEWDTIKQEDPTTYCNFTKELMEAGIPEGYIETLKMKIIQVCGLDPERIEEATKRFLASQELAPNQ